MFYIELLESPGREQGNQEIIHSYIFMPAINGLTVTNPKLSLEYGKIGSLTFSMPYNHPLRDKMNLLSTTIAVGTVESPHAKKYEIWRGRLVAISQDIFQNCEITCEGILGCLNDVLLPTTLSMEYNSPFDYLNYIVTKYNEVNQFPERSINGISTDTDINNPITVERTDYNSIWYEINNFFVANYGGQFSAMAEDYGGINLNWYVEQGDYSGDKLYKLEYGYNMSDCQMDEDANDLINDMILDVYDNNDEFSFQTGYMVDSSIQKYGDIQVAGRYKMYLSGNFDRDEQIASNVAKEYVQKKLSSSVSIQATGIDPMFIFKYKTYHEPLLNVGMKVDVITPSMIKNLTIQKIDYDLSNPANTSYSLGKVSTTLSGLTGDKELSNEIQIISNTY